MADKTEICNLALSHCGVSTFIANAATDQTKEARICNKHWDAALAFLLRDIDWNFNREYPTLALLEGDVPSLWTYKYAYPSRCLAFRAILTPAVKSPIIGQRILYELAVEDATDSTGIRKVIYTDQVDAVARISIFITDVSLLDATAAMAQSYLLASLIATPLTVKPAIATANRQAYFSIIQQATANNFKESEDGPEPEELETIRNG